MSGTLIPPVGCGVRGWRTRRGSGSDLLVLLDTTVLIDHIRGRPAAGRVINLRTRGDVPCTTALNIDEVARGVLEDERERVHTFIGGLRLLPMSAAVGWRAGRWRADFASRGITLSQADCLVAAAALESSARLATGNPRDFPMPGLDLDHWPVGE